MIEKMTPIQEKITDLHFKMQQRIEANQIIREHRQKMSQDLKDNLAKYPLTPDQAYPDASSSTFFVDGKPLGKVVVNGVGGDFDVDQFKKLWMEQPTVWDKTPRNYGTMTSHHMGFIDFGVSHELKFSDRVRPVYGTYPRRMLLLL